jgi:hypothetical protein
MYLNHRAIVDSPSIATAVDPVPFAKVPQPSFLSAFKPWQIAVIATLAVAAWAAPVGLLILFFGR